MFSQHAPFSVEMMLSSLQSERFVTTEIRILEMVAHLLVRLNQRGGARELGTNIRFAVKVAETVFLILGNYVMTTTL